MATSPPMDAAPGGGQPEAQGGAPSISAPKAGGAISGLGEKFQVNAVNGTSSCSLPLKLPAGRGGLTPHVSLDYDSGSGAGLFGFGWSVALPAITRKTDKGLPLYNDAIESDTFILSGVEDLVRLLCEEDGRWRLDLRERRVDGRDYLIQRFRPRVEAGFARIERWTERRSGETHWRTISPHNVTSLYGRTAESRIADPDDPTRCFSWLICETYDDAGNAILYEYKADDSAGVDLRAPHEAERTEAQRAGQRHVKRIRHGNRRPAQGHCPPDEWLFETVFDYGDHHPDRPLPREDRPWSCRADPFSSYRATFELRTYRLCQRILVFHHFPDEDSVGADCLVRSLDLSYRGDPVRGESRGAFLASATQRGYRRRGGGYLRRATPPTSFTYTEARLQGSLREVDPESVANLPQGVGGDYRWLDLDGEGLPGILTEQGQTWYYMHNLGDVHFAPAAPVASKPSLGALGAGMQQFMDVDGDGRMDLLALQPDVQGFHPRTDHGWADFRPFRDNPQVDWTDPNLRWIDLDGDGLSDILIPREDGFIWYRAEGTEGFAAPRRVFTTYAGDERSSPRLMFSDPARAIYLADMSGDGLSDIVRVANGEVCYWPNLGHGRFGAKVTMDRSPRIDGPDRFEKSLVRLVDIDGTGATDLLYLAGGTATIWFNQQGNGWSAPERLSELPDINPLSEVQAIDLLGTGTACLIWSSAAPAAARRPMRFIDLMGGIKPHLLSVIDNNMGVERRIKYTASTHFYLADRAEGRPWATRLPFPVQVVTRVETLDRVGGNRFRVAYSYRHGFYDRHEREFRGFGMVEQVDSMHFATFSEEDRAGIENLDAASHVPPIRTRTWHHVGEYEDARRLGHQYEHEYSREPDANAEAARAIALPPPRLPPELLPEELREAHRALKNAVLRREVYADDGSTRADLPYSVLATAYEVRRLQPQGPNRFAGYFLFTRETLDCNYERALYPVGDRLRADPRISHSLALDVDAFGNLLRSVSVTYGRRHPDCTLPPAIQHAQATPRIGLDLTTFTNPIDLDDAHRLPAKADVRNYELYGIRPQASLPGTTTLLRLGETATLTAMACDGAHDRAYADREPINDGPPSRRLIEHQCVRYRRDDLSGPLPVGKQESLGLQFDSRTLALTAEIVDAIYGDRVSAGTLSAAGYRTVDGEDGWWKPSGKVFYSPGPDDLPERELAFARAHFFAQHRFEDPFGVVTTVAYDPYTLLIQETRDAVGNRNTAGERDPAGALTRQGNDYRVLQPWLVTDANRNRTEAAFDALGIIVATARRGKPEEDLGDTLDGFEPDLPGAVVRAHLADPLAAPEAILRGATTCMVYDLFGVMRDGPRSPAVRSMIARTVHRSDAGASSHQQDLTYSDGFNRDIQKIAQAEPGALAPGDVVLASPWIVSGWTVYDNKGNPVRQYEPFFVALPAFVFGRRVGVSSIMLYDPASRVVARVHPNHSFEKVVLDPWSQTSWDVNDTVLMNPTEDADIGDIVRRLPVSDALPTWYEHRRDGALGPDEREAAEKAAAHAHTPSRTCFDAMGRAILAVAHNRSPAKDGPADGYYATRLDLDFEGNRRGVWDARGRVAQRVEFDMGGQRLFSIGQDSAARRELIDVRNRVVLSWDSRGHRLRTTYDPLGRPSHIHLRAGGAVETLINRIDYGERAPDADRRNLRARTYRTYDASGIATAEAYDFKGNVVRSSRQLVREVRTDPDWNQNPALEDETFEQRTTYDALNRPTQLIPPHVRGAEEAVSVIQPRYNTASLLECVDVWTARSEAPDELLDPHTASHHVITGIDYDAKGQRTCIAHGNGARTRYDYEPLTFRLARIATERGRDAPPAQDLRYTYDPAGNITSIRDASQPDVWFRGSHVEAHSHYVYDAIYRLIEATGREHLGQRQLRSELRAACDRPMRTPPGPGEAHAFAPYRERYAYDEAGNMLELLHRRLDAAGGGFRRAFVYEEASPIDPDQPGDRLSATRTGEVVDRFCYDEAGNCEAMPHLAALAYDHRDQLRHSVRRRVTQGEAETSWYVYDSTGRRIRKVTTRASEHGVGTRRREQIYLDGFEMHRDYEVDGETIRRERTTLHVADGNRIAALIERRTRGQDAGVAELVRYQHQNHQSTVLELDDRARLISYEEYLPFGGSAYRLAATRAEAPKRYRYNNKERDRETGLYYYGARYYAAWLGRWISCDPKFQDDWPNAYTYTRDNPVVFSDPDGAEESSNWNRVMGGLKLIGGTGQALLGVGVFVQIEVPVAAQVVGGIAIAHGADDMYHGFKQIITGKEEKTWTQQVVAGTAKEAGMDKDKAEALGTGVDIAAGFVSPAPITGAGKGAAVVITVNAPRLRVLTEAETGMKVLNLETRAVQLSASASGVATGAGALQAVGTLGSTGGSGSGGNKDDGKDDEPKKTEEAKVDPREVKTVTSHAAGNKQVTVNGQRWNLPKGTDSSKIPAVDKVGDELQAATKTAAGQWNASKLSLAEREAIRAAEAGGEGWRVPLLKQQAKGRWVEKQVRNLFPNLKWSRQGVDAIDPATGVKYDILSGSKSNMDRHAKRMADVLFRMITF